MAKKTNKKSAAKKATGKAKAASKSATKRVKTSAKTGAKKTAKTTAKATHKAAAKKANKASTKPKHVAKKGALKPKKAPSSKAKPAGKASKAPAKPVAKKPLAKASAKPVAAKAAPKLAAVKKPLEKAATTVKVTPEKTVKPIVTKPKIPKYTGPIVTTVRRGIVKAAGESDEDTDAFGFNLLAGPRNVTPYLAKKGEEYMGKEQLEHFRTILMSWKQDLMEEVDRTVTHMKDEAANPPDPNDRATLESEFSLELRTRDRERKLIRKIDEAIQRIEDGSYGYCLETGEEIGIKRLEARPVATLSIEAQERRERREKQYGDRDDRYR
jgi:DnaK suppressor protein